MNDTMIKCGCGTKRCESFANPFVQAASSRTYPIRSYMGDDGRTYQQNAAFFCLTCGKSFRVAEIRARKNTTPCSGICTHAKGGDCECSCGGKNHGASL